MVTGARDTPSPRQRGDHVVLRELWRGRVWYARPAVVVEDGPDLRMFFVPPGVTALVPVDDDGTPLRLYTDRWSLRRERRSATGVLSFAFPDTAYAVIHAYMPDGTPPPSYVNLQSPLVPTAIGFDTVEHILDVVIAPDRSSWRWKDEDELAEAVARGIFSADDAATFRAWGERAIAHVVDRRTPFDRDWADWRPDPAWTNPELPPDATHVR